MKFTNRIPEPTTFESTFCFLSFSTVTFSFIFSNSEVSILRFSTYASAASIAVGL